MDGEKKDKIIDAYDSVPRIFVASVISTNCPIL